MTQRIARLLRSCADRLDPPHQPDVLPLNVTWLDRAVTSTEGWVARTIRDWQVPS